MRYNNASDHGRSAGIQGLQNMGTGARPATDGMKNIQSGSTSQTNGSGTVPAAPARTIKGPTSNSVTKGC